MLFICEIETLYIYIFYVKENSGNKKAQMRLGSVVNTNQIHFSI